MPRSARSRSPAVPRVRAAAANSSEVPAVVPSSTRKAGARLRVADLLGLAIISAVAASYVVVFAASAGIKSTNLRALVLCVVLVGLIAGLGNKFGANASAVTACLAISSVDLVQVSAELASLKIQGFESIASIDLLWLRLWSASGGLLITGQLALLLVPRAKFSSFFSLFWLGSMLPDFLVEIFLTVHQGRAMDLLHSGVRLFALMLMCIRLKLEPRRAGAWERLRLHSAGSDSALIMYHSVELVALVARALVLQGSRTQLAMHWSISIEPLLMRPSVQLHLLVGCAFWLMGVVHSFSLGEICYRIGAGRRGVLGNFGVELSILAHGFYLAFSFVWIGLQTIDLSSQSLNSKPPSLETILLAVVSVVGSLLQVIHWFSTDRHEVGGKDD